MRIYMQQNQGLDRIRFYHLILQEDLLGGWSLIKESGVQGAAGRTNRQYFDSLEQAQSAMLKARDRQLKRGYQVVFMQALSQK